MVYWNIPYGEDGRKPVQDLFWYPGEHHGIPQDKMIYWNIPYGKDGRKPVQDLPCIQVITPGIPQDKMVYWCTIW
jgi:hypothetical protein